MAVLTPKSFIVYNALESHIKAAPAKQNAFIIKYHFPLVNERELGYLCTKSFSVTMQDRRHKLVCLAFIKFTLL